MIQNKKYIALAILIATLFACSPVETEVGPENLITSGDGIEIELEWSTGGSVSQALDEANLDLILRKDENEVYNSNYYFSFENVQIQDIYTDGDYFIDIYYFSGNTSLEYTLYVRGLQDNESQSYTSSFSASDEKVTIQYLKIRKEGNKYTITDL